MDKSMDKLMDKPEKRAPEKPWKSTMKNGKTGFTRQAERKCFFYLTLMMLAAGIAAKFI